MLNSAAACSNTQVNTTHTVPAKKSFDWMSFLNRLGKLLALSHVTLYK
ncbi:hypothetical protein PSECIP111951_03699 [Pseudoalteromonas holothuriae]|uniref:Uncharacterized protein n=1 Tax=Pseudoalteromonas holothuriae TaxID=2963714 RepID=A0A9W4VUZ8_9GAMM|nr:MULTISPECIES: hypothetical protein [unclassified Pseudoalteromonas]CAH9065381.1 hypothetical protein PSECIP111854_03671 [Pseudoalteromonas sp. CIP111854]CAH9067057.1 hypothetical protein PSECIP111951_03699 [Pseudoalteromonas sp. CIP111951]